MTVNDQEETREIMAVSFSHKGGWYVGYSDGSSAWYDQSYTKKTGNHYQNHFM